MSFPESFGEVLFVLQAEREVVPPPLHKLQFLILIIDLVATEV